MGFFDAFKPVEFNTDGTIRTAREGKGRDKSTTKPKPKPKAKKVKKAVRSRREERNVKMCLEYISSIKYEIADEIEHFTAQEKRSAIVLLNRAIKQLEAES